MAWRGDRLGGWRSPSTGRVDPNSEFEPMSEPPERRAQVRTRLPDAEPVGLEPKPSAMSRKYRNLSRVIPELAMFPTDKQRKVAMRNASSILGPRSSRLWLWLLLFLMAAGGLIAVAPQITSLHPIAGRLWPSLIVPLMATWMWFCRSVVRRRLCEQLVAKGVPICIKCGYDLRGQNVPRCPECGTPFDETLLNASGETPASDQRP